MTAHNRRELVELACAELREALLADIDQRTPAGGVRLMLALRHILVLADTAIDGGAPEAVQ